ncbi:MAG: sigma-70 family RNA polymerase sigma factor [Isosphaerales bacterium]
MNTSPSTNPEIDALLRDAAQGDVQAVRCLLEKHRTRLRRMIAARLDPRLAPRLDPSDVVQETLADAARRLPDYLRDRPLPFYPWLHRLAADRLAWTHRHHVASTVRGIGREEFIDWPSHDEATLTRLVDRLAANDTTPGHRMAREERRLLLARAIARMGEADRVILGLRYLDQLAFDEIAAVLEIGLGAAKMRHLRALERLRGLLEEVGVEPSTEHG